MMLPDGSDVRSDQQNVNAVLSQMFDPEITLAEIAPDSPLLEEYWC
jgi:hypothetical protein